MFRLDSETFYKNLDTSEFEKLKICSKKFLKLIAKMFQKKNNKNFMKNCSKHFSKTKLYKENFQKC